MEQAVVGQGEKTCVVALGFEQPAQNDETR